MPTARQDLERGLQTFQELAQRIPELARELEESRSHYFASGQAERADKSLADRRHLEWFLLERPSDHLGGVPCEVLASEWVERSGRTTSLGPEAFLQSLAGAFEVTASEPGRGLWARDLFGLGEYPIEEAEAAGEIRTGDLLVGRVFPIGDGVFRLSPAVSCFRNPDLVGAVRADIERLRGARRGVLRIQQIELERLFFGDAPIAGDVPEFDLEAERQRAHEALVVAGLSAADSTRALELVRQAASEGRSVVTELLNELAFDTDADLDQARRTLVDLWAVETHGADLEPARTAQGATTGVATRSRRDEVESSPADVRAALEAFDAGRAEGQDLDALFAQLADDLGVDAPADEDVSGSLQDFPGVLGAMVEEFLWDVAREQGDAHAARLEGLRRLSQYGAHIGLFEDFRRREILDFAGRWLLDEGELRGSEEARSVLDALRSFCAWCVERHGHEELASCDELLQALASSVPRHVLVRQETLARDAEDTPWFVDGFELEDVLLTSDDGKRKRLRVSESMRSLLRTGDVVHARPVDGSWRMSASYPAELRELLERAEG